MKKYKIYSKISLVLLLAMSLNLVMVPNIGAARLTSAKDTMTRAQISGTGSATAGYTQSTAAVTDAFIFADTVNDIICFDKDDTASFDAACTGAGNVKVDIITSGGLIGEAVYTGDQVATAIKTALESQDGDTDDTYTVAYDESTDKFTIRGDGGNTLNASLGWLTYTSADNAGLAFGYTADNNNIRTTAATSNNAVSFIVLDNVNDNFTVKVDGVQSATLDVATGNYTTGATLATAITAVITGAAASYTSNKFKITSSTTGANSTVRVVEDSSDDFLKLVKLVGDVPVDGAAAGTSIAANHTVVFITTTAVANGGKVVITFPADFGISNIIEDDTDIVGSTAGELTTAADCTGAEKAGVSKSGQVITLELCAGDGGAFLASETVTIEIGRNATASGTGSNQIINPTTVGLYQILVKTTTAADVTIDDSYIGVYIIPDDSVVITATVDPVLSLSLYGGTYIDFGTLEPNAYQKLGGARNAYGYINLAAITPSGTHEGQLVTIRSKIYEFSDDGVIAATSNAKVDIVDNQNNYLTAIQVAANLYRAINNYDGDSIRANFEPTDTDKVWVMATAPGSAANSYTIATTVTGTSVSGATFANGNDGYNQKSSTVNYGAGSGVGNAATGTNIVISTNAAGGYVLTVQNTDSNSANNNYDGLTNGIVEISQWSGSYGYGILASSQSARYGDGTSSIIASGYQGDGVGDSPGAMSTSTNTLASYSGTTAGDNVAIEYNIRILPDQAAGLYTDTITYILTSTF